jgi:hypothetical protein
MKLVLGHTPNNKKWTIEHKVASFATHIMPKENYRFIKPQNGPTFNEHVAQSLHVSLGKAPLAFIHMSTRHVSHDINNIKTIVL